MLLCKCESICESIVEKQTRQGKSQRREDKEEEAGEGTDRGSRLNGGFPLKPTEKRFNRLPAGSDIRIKAITRKQCIQGLLLSGGKQSNFPVILKLGSPGRIRIGAVSKQFAVSNRSTV